MSFYKGLGGISGCCVAGDRDVIDELAVWRTRHGARPYMLWPYAASALTVLRERPRDMAAYYRRARAIAQRLRGLDDLELPSGQGRPDLAAQGLDVAHHQDGRHGPTVIERSETLCGSDPDPLSGPRGRR